MLRHKPYALRATLLFTSLLFGSVSAFAQKTTNPLLPNVNLGLSAPNVGVGLNVAVPPVVVPRTVVGVPAGLPVSGLTPPLGANVNVNTGGSAPVLAVGLDVSGSTLGVSVGDGGIPGAPPAPNFPASGPAATAQDPLAQKRLDLLPTCR